jgi:acyl carrier protein
VSPRELILKVIAEVRADSELPPVQEIRDDDLLGEEGLGLDSVDMATIVAQLDSDLNYDPFAHGNPSFQTVGEFVKLYEDAPGE